MKSIGIYIIVGLCAASLALPALAAEHVSLVITGSRINTPGAVSERRVFPPDAGSISAHLTFTSKEKSRVRFSWFSPDGERRSNTAKLVFPDKSTEAVAVSDDFDCRGETGWWRVEVAVNNDTYSKIFLVTADNAPLAVGLGDKSTKIDTLDSLDGSEPGARDAVKAASMDPDEQVRAAGVSAAGRIGERAAQELIEHAAADESASSRLAAAHAAISLPDAQARAILERLASDPSSAVRRSVAESVAQTDPVFAAKILGQLVADSDSTVRDSALTALSGLEGPEAVSALSKASAVKDTAFRAKVLETLTAKSGPGKDEALSGFLTDKSPEIRLAALNELSKTGGVNGFDNAMPLLGDPDETVALAAVRIMSGAGYVDALTAALKSRHTAVRSYAVQYAPTAGGSVAAKVLEEAVKDPDVSIRGASIDRLAELGADGVPGLLYALGDPEPGLRVKAAEVIASLRPPSAYGEMSVALDDSDPKVRRLALVYFSGSRGPEAYAMFEKAASDQSEAVRMQGINALIAHKDIRSSGLLAVYYRNGGIKERYAVVEELAGREDHIASKLLGDALDDPEAGIRLAAVNAMAEKGRAAELAPLALDTDQEVKRAALEAMKSSPEPGMADVLKAALEDPNPGIRLMALAALSEIGGPEAGRAVSAALKDGATEVSELAGRILLKRRDEGAVMGLVALMDDADAAVRLSAVDSLAGIPGGRVDELTYEAIAKGSASASARVLAIEVLRRRRSGMLAPALVRAMGDRDGRVRAAALDAAGSLVGDERRDVYLSALSSSYAETRLGGVRGLKGQGGDVVIVGLLHALSDDDPRVRLGALSRLGELRAPELAAYLPELVRDRNRDVASAALEAARPMDTPFDRVTVLVAAASAAHEDIAREAVELLLETKDPRAFPVFGKFFRDGYKRDELLRACSAIPGDSVSVYIGAMYRLSARDESLRISTVRALSGRGAVALDILKDALSDPSTDVRLEAVRSISLLADTPGRADALGMAVKGTDSAVSGAALGALSGLDDPEAAVLMLPALNKDGLRAKALTGIAAKAGQEALPALAGSIGLVHYPSARAEVARLLEKKGVDTSYLYGFLDDSAEEVRDVAVAALSARGGAEGVYGLLIAGAGNDPAIREKAAAALSVMEPAVVRQGLAAHFENGTADERMLMFAADTVRGPELLSWIVGQVPARDTARLRAVLSPVIQRKDPGEAPAVVEGLKSSDAQFQAELVACLAALEPADAEHALKMAFKRYPGLRPLIVKTAADSGRSAAVARIALEYGGPDIKAAAVAGLEGADCGAVEGLLLVALQDTDAAVRLSSVKVAGGSACASALFTAAGDPSADVRAAAASALGAVRAPGSLEALTGLARDEDCKVSSAALDSLSGMGEAVPVGVWKGLASASMSASVRLAALTELLNSCGRDCAPLFVEALKDGDPAIADAGESGLASLGPDALSGVYPLLEDEILRVRAIGVIGRIADPASEGPLLAVFPALEGDALFKAVEAVGRLGGRASLDALAGVYSQGDNRLKVVALKAVAGLRLSGDEPALAGLLSGALEDDYESVRFYSARAVGESGVSALEPTLRNRLEREGSNLVKIEIKRALERLGSLSGPG